MLKRQSKSRSKAAGLGGYLADAKLESAWAPPRFAILK
jgi:hypothetical protein